MPEVLPDMGFDFDATYEGFLAASAVMDFEDHEWFYPVTFTQEMVELPHTGTPNGSLPAGLGQNFFRIDSGTNPDGKDLQVTFASDEEADWYVVLATTSDESTVSDYAVATKDAKTGAWVAQIAWDGQSDAYMTVSPKSDSVSHDYEYEYRVELFDPPAAIDTGDTGTGTEEAEPRGAEKQGGCASAGASASWLLAALAAMTVRRRRR